MNCFIILYLLLCHGNCNFGCHNSCGDNGTSCIQPRSKSDCGCPEKCEREEHRDFFEAEREAAPPWIRSSYSNGDSCGCEEV